ncbi:MAG TPA: ceramidase domain-containing protein [Gammaproteobacteria bacterium]|nr:ceramidase domain-containing protein [Gammaproteobacteria bacterium]
MQRGWQLVWIGVLLLAPALILALAPPLPQSQVYHDFADQRILLGIPNLLNILSNLPFLLTGLAGLGLCLSRPPSTAPLSWLCFFIAFSLVALGSSYYHRAPADATLVWDRLPMTLAFMSVFSAILNDTVFPGCERHLLPPLLALGLSSVIWWRCSGDLRFYAWVQFAPLLCIAFLMKFHGFRELERGGIYAAFLAYVLAKICEALDSPIYDLTRQWVSGHSLKHLAAAASGGFLYSMLRRHRQRSQYGHRLAQDSRVDEI